MKSFLIIGLGNFGYLLTKALSGQKCDLLAVDWEESAVARVLPLGISARIGDCTDPETLRSFDIPAFDACFVSVGSHFQTSLVITDHLKNLGARCVYVKASEEVQARFLKRIGADHIIYPEQEAAENLAVSAANDSIFDCIPLAEDYNIYEITAPASWIGKSIRDLNVRAVYNISILATKKGDRIQPMPPVSYLFNREEHLVVLSSTRDIKKITK